VDPLVLLLLVIIVLAGGFIGVFADHLGRRIGKKKLSFRSMRPKHVARVGTFIAGTLVSLITILLVYFTSSGIREWITQGRAAITKSRELTSQNAKLAAEIAAKTAAIERLNLAAQLAQKNLHEASTRLASIKAQLATANTRLAEARKRVTQGQLALARNQSLLRQNQALLKSRQAQLAQVAANLLSARQRYAELQKSYTAMDKERTEANDEIRRLRVEERKLTTSIASLQSEREGLTRQVAQDTADLHTLRDDLHSTRVDLANAKGELEGAKRDLQTAIQAAAGYRTVAAIVRSEPETYEMGEELARRRVGPHPSQRQARGALTELMREASQAAKAKGAGTGTVNDSCVVLAKYRGQDDIEVDPSDLQQMIVDGLTASDQEVVLIATAAVNSFKGEQVGLKVTAFHNPIVYHKGDVLGVLQIGRRAKTLAVFNLFTGFMNETIHARAIKDGMIPAVGQEGSLVNLEPSKTITLVERLSNSDRALQLQIVAHGDTRAADPLQLDFAIK